MADVLAGFDKWTAMAKLLNDIIIDTNEGIQKDNVTIWQGHLHQYSNDDWDNMLSVLEAAYEEDATMFRDYDVTNINNARYELNKGIAGNISRALDKKNTKRYAWAVLMTMREVYNRFKGLDIPNRPGQARLKPAATNNYSQLFTQ